MLKQKLYMEDTFIKDVSHIIEQNMTNPDFDVQELADLLFISRTQLFRKIRRIEGLSPTTFIRHYRLKKGRMLLLNSYLIIKEIAYQVGFKDPAHFSKAYKKLYGISPKEERE